MKRYEPYSSFVLANGSEEAGERYGENYEFWKGILRGREDVLEAPDGVSAERKAIADGEAFQSDGG